MPVEHRTNLCSPTYLPKPYLYRVSARPNRSRSARSRAI